MNTRSLLLTLGSTLALAAGLAAAAPAAPAASRPAHLDADYLLQARIRGAAAAAPAAQGRVSPADDAAGAVDGRKDGKWGFHTSGTESPAWWHVDLGQSHRLASVVVYNRCDTAERNRNIELLLSPDGKQWATAYRHAGPAFFGHTDGKPLTIPLNGAAARYVRLQVASGFFHLDEVEVYGADSAKTNLALRRPANQSSISEWSRKHDAAADVPTDASLAPQLATTIDRGRKLAADLATAGVAVAPALAELDAVAAAAKSAPADQQPGLYLRARAAVRQLTLANPLLDFDSILFVKRAPGTYSHMSDQYYSWWSRPGGGVYVLSNIKSDAPALRCLTEKFPEGSFLAPDLSHDAKRILFAYCRYYPGRAKLANKVDKDAQPEDAFYHVFEMNVDGSNCRQLTHGRYDDTFPRYLPSGEIVFLSTRRGTALQCGPESAQATLTATLPDSYVRCGGGNSRPVAIYTLHTVDAAGQNMRAISAFESFEWDPAVTADGRIFYARWDYVDRDNMPYMKLWATNPDGTNPQIVFGNYTKNPHCTVEARPIPGSSKILATASAHHSITGGSLILLDPTLGLQDGDRPITRLTPEVCFNETEGWANSYYVSPYPLSDRYFLTAWSPVGMVREGGSSPPNATGLYLYDAFGNLELLHRDPAISSMYPIPLKPRTAPPTVASTVDWAGPREGKVVVRDVYHGLTGVERGTVKRLRIVAMPVKTQPQMNTPVIGLTTDDPGKAVLGTVPVEADGSAHFRLPAGVGVFFQALDEGGRAVQTMRSLTYVQPGQTLSCIGCHEDRAATPAAAGLAPLAVARPASRITPAPDGAFPLRFDRLVQPLLDAQCIRCHAPASTDAHAAKLDLTPAKSYASLVAYGKPSLTQIVQQAYRDGRSRPNNAPSQISPLLPLLTGPTAHYDTRLDAAALDRLTLWMDTYAQRQGHFSKEQETDLTAFRQRIAEMFEAAPAPRPAP